MLSAVFGLILSAHQVEKAHLLKATLPNGAMVLIQRAPQARQTTVTLLAMTGGKRETPETHGRRHLLEHLLAKGESNGLDKRLEAKGGFLTAATTRDAMLIAIQSDPTDLGLALSGIREMLVAPTFTPEAIATEAKIIEQELLLTEAESSFFAKAWNLAYGDNGLDPYGSIESISSATPDDLKAIHRDLYRGSRVMLVVSGPVDVDQAMSLAKPLVVGLPASPPEEFAPIPKGAAGEGSNDRGFGECRGAIVGGLLEQDTLPAIAAAIALCSTHPEWRVTYTPSIQKGLVLVRTSIKGDLAPIIDTINDEELYRHWEIGKALLPLWLANMSADGALRGLLLRQEANLTPEKLLEQAKSMSFDQFKRGMDSFRRGRAVVVVGK